jgi:hypothetical protein
MDEPPQQTWVKPRSLKKYILDWGCEQYAELVALRIEVCATSWPIVMLRLKVVGRALKMNC